MAPTTHPAIDKGSLWGSLNDSCVLQVMDKCVPRDSLLPPQLLTWTDATQLKLFDRSVALKAEQDSTSTLSKAIDLAKLSQEKSFQMTQNRLIWKQNRIACMERLAARRAQQAMPPGDPSSTP